MSYQPHYSLPTFASDALNDETYEQERLRASYGSGVQSSLTRLDILPNTLKAGAIQQKKQDHTYQNLQSHIKNGFAVRSVSKYEGFSSFAYIMEGNITNSINRQLKIASKPAFRPTSNSFQKGKYKELLSDHHLSPSPTKPITLTKKVDEDDDDGNNHYVEEADYTKVLPAISTTNRSFSNLITEISPTKSLIRPKTVASSSAIASEADGITRRIFSRYRSHYKTSSNDKKTSTLTKSSHFDKSKWITREFFEDQRRQWKQAICQYLEDDWGSLLAFLVDWNSLNELEVKVSFISRSSHLGSLKKYMDCLVDRGYAHSQGLTRSPLRWCTVESSSDLESENCLGECLVFVFLPPGSQGSVRQAFQQAATQQRYSTQLHLHRTY
jgi:hypothetical protein